MAKYRVKVHVELVECDDTVNHEPKNNNDGSFSMTISESDAISIDMCEKIRTTNSFSYNSGGSLKAFKRDLKKKRKKEAWKKERL